MSNDVLSEILLHLPVRSLFRFRAVCEFWCDIIDSPRFRELHNKLHNNNNNYYDNADAVYLQFTLLGNRRKLELSTKLLDNGKSLKSNDLTVFYPKSVRIADGYKLLVVAGAAKGLICISSIIDTPPKSICICNPFLGQFKILPLSPHSSHPPHCPFRHNVGVGFDEDYKVVHLQSCAMHNHHSANLYSKRTNSWRELAFDQEAIFPIKSLCKNGAFAHWEGWAGSREETCIISFDMRNEMFRTIRIWGSDVLCGGEIFAKDECSFLRIVSPCPWPIKVYESRSEGSDLKWNWNYVVRLELHYYNLLPIWSSSDYMVFKNVVVILKIFPHEELCFYDYRAQKFIGQSIELPADSDIIEFEGSFVSP